ncbi:MAG: hypothetical protein IPN19_02175 [Elusimicrobia bacterium]|nr:hypothetical protein [Elusimicrobiota bacterium]
MTRNVSTTVGGTQSSDTTTTVNYTYDGNGVLSGATGDVRGTSGSQVFDDVVRNGATVRELVWQETAVTGQTSIEDSGPSAGDIERDAQRIDDGGWDAGSDTTTTVNYTYNENGQLTGAAGSVRGRAATRCLTM